MFKYLDDVLSLMLYEYVNLIIWIAVILGVSWALEKLWSRSVARWVYLTFATPGIIIHELSHLTMCLLTGARVTKVVLISREGGSVTHGPPKGGMFGQALVSMAPFLGIPLVIVLVGLMFDMFLGCEISWDLTISGSVGQVVLDTFSSAFRLVKVNLVDRGAYWFLLYIVFSASLMMGLSPSAKDFKNGLIGLVAILLGVLVWIVAMESLFPGWDFPLLAPLLDILGWIVVIGLVASLLGAVLALPFLIVKRMAG